VAVAKFQIMRISKQWDCRRFGFSSKQKFDYPVISNTARHNEQHLVDQIYPGALSRNSPLSYPYYLASGLHSMHLTLQIATLLSRSEVSIGATQPIGC
jgi:hypothetical protein